MAPKLIKKLADKKYRTETGLFLVEGEKNILELLTSDLRIIEIVGTRIFLDDITHRLRAHEARVHSLATLTLAKEDELAHMGTLMSNNAGIAVVEQQRASDPALLVALAQRGFLLALDDVRDPGNLGTIMRIADWFGVTHIVASPTTTDVYNPKTIAASMGSFVRVGVTYLPLPALLEGMVRISVPIMGAVLDGANIHDGGLPKHGVLVMGSESHGIGDEIVPFISQKITIPKYGGAESLNVSVATGILLDALRRG